MEINGMAHVIVTVPDLKRSRKFYAELLPFLGMQVVRDTEEIYYCVGGRTAFGVRAGDPKYRGEKFVQARVGLHHACFRARSREDVDALYKKLVELKAHIVHPPEEGEWAPGYYSVLFEDPDGIRLEMNFVPGKGLLADKLENHP
jgi:catechol 2,3-dioxygenase-like lactoylglutathione lyase family enzyme